MKPRNLAETNTQWEYMQAFIRVNTRMTPQRTDAEIAHTIIHEIGHILLAELETEKSKRQMKAEERVCTMLALWAMEVMEQDFGEATDGEAAEGA